MMELVFLCSFLTFIVGYELGRFVGRRMPIERKPNSEIVTKQEDKQMKIQGTLNGIKIDNE